jgi:predicted CopG family antitoxin
VIAVPTTVQVAEKTLQMLNELKKEVGARSHDEVIRMLISERKKIPRSMFGSNPNLRPFSRKDEAEFHEL